MAEPLSPGLSFLLGSVACKRNFHPLSINGLLISRALDPSPVLNPIPYPHHDLALMAWDMAQLVEYLPSMHEAATLGLISSTA